MKNGITRVGVIGCGNISGIYLKNLMAFNNTTVAAVADLDMDRARNQARAFGVPRACAVRELLADPEIKIVVNLTIPKAHADVAFAVVNAGKSVYNEKPLTVRFEDGEKLLALAGRKNVRVGGAPDTFLGGGFQACRRLIDEGAIGRPVAAAGFMICHGHESWHPSPEFYYEKGGGPLFDMGPYYLTALVSLLGPVKRVSGSAQKSFPFRIITSKPKFGKRVKVEVPTHAVGVLDFVNGAVATVVTTFDVWRTPLPNLEIYGTEGSLRLPDPNNFSGDVLMWSKTRECKSVNVTRPYQENSRGLGVADMAAALLRKRAHRANGAMALHVLEIMHGIHEASRTGRYRVLKTRCDRPAALPAKKEF